MRLVIAISFLLKSHSGCRVRDKRILSSLSEFSGQTLARGEELDTRRIPAHDPSTKSLQELMYTLSLVVNFLVQEVKKARVFNPSILALYYFRT
jgi:hypothetical protein